MTAALRALQCARQLAERTQLGVLLEKVQQLGADHKPALDAGPHRRRKLLDSLGAPLIGILAEQEGNSRMILHCALQRYHAHNAASSSAKVGSIPVCTHAI